MPETVAPEAVRPSRWKKLAAWTAVLVGLIAVGIVGFLTLHKNKPHVLPPTTIDGSVLKNAIDSEKQQPIADVDVLATAGNSSGQARSNEVGYFRVVLRPGVPHGTPVTFQFRHPDYKPLDVNEMPNAIVIARLTPLHEDHQEPPAGPQVDVSNIVVRYSIRAVRTENTGSAVKTFQVVNTGNVPCNGTVPCSPGSKWKATMGGITLDAGEGNQFQNARVSCISGPCAFTRIEANKLSDDGRKMTVSALNWSDTTTFLVEAEVVHRMVSDINVDTYPVIYGQALNFNLPPTAEGFSIEANLNKDNIVFPMGPDLCLSWADCKVSVAKDQTKSYRCELKPAYKFAGAQ